MKTVYRIILREQRWDFDYYDKARQKMIDALNLGLWFADLNTVEIDNDGQVHKEISKINELISLLLKEEKSYSKPHKRTLSLINELAVLRGIDLVGKAIKKTPLKDKASGEKTK